MEIFIKICIGLIALGYALLIALALGVVIIVIYGNYEKDKIK